MKLTLIMFLLAGFTAIAVFGIFSMHIGMNNHDAGCIASVAQGTDCPKQANPFDYLAFHFDAFKYFLIVIFGDNAIFSLVFSLFIVGFAFKNLFWNFSPPKPNFVEQRLKQFNSFNSPLRQKLLQWLAFYNNSPNTL